MDKQLEINLLNTLSNLVDALNRAGQVDAVAIVTSKITELVEKL